ncbi:Lipoprotein signal peptidase [Pseudoclavibacter triregionum]|nr:Lipoprotein signal peptidase [Pseudoclavibacter triregionum]
MADRSSGVEPAARQRPRTIALAIVPAVAVGVSALDQLTKAWVVSSLPEGETVPVLGPVLQWHFVRNPGAAFSMASGMTWIFTIIAIAVVIAIVLIARRLRSRLWALVLGLVLGGVLGNLTDRLFREPGFGVGHVIDFISTPWMMPAIYNIADSAIVVGMCTLVLLTLLDRRLDGTRPKDRAGGDADAEVDAEVDSPPVDARPGPQPADAAPADAAPADPEPREEAAR